MVFFKRYLALAVFLLGLLIWLLVTNFSSISGLFGNSSNDSARRGSSSPRTIPVVLGQSSVADVPIRLRLLGSVQPIASVAVRPRVEGQVEEIFVLDGSLLKAGDQLARIDSRSIEAKIRQAEANIERSKALFSQAERDEKRSETLSASEFSSKVTLENSRTQLATLTADIEAYQAALDDLRVQQSFYTITAPISGRIGSVTLKSGSLAKTGDSSAPIVIINQVDPIYVTFDLEQSWIDEVRAAIRLGSSKVTVTPPGYAKSYTGKLVGIENAVDQSSGTINVKAEFNNVDEGLWPGLICVSTIDFRVESDLVLVPQEAIQTGQRGTFVYVAEDGFARMRNISVSRYFEGFGVVSSGLSGGESVVVEGQYQLSDGVKITPVKSTGSEN